MNRVIIKYSIVFFLYLFFVTELLSFFSCISAFTIVISYIPILIYFGRKKGFNDSFKIYAKKILSNKVYLFISIYFLFLLVLSIIIPPNNWDSMTYHLPRIEHWIQNQSINYYPTENLRQIFHQPFAEYILLHIRLLTFSDYFLNALQLVFLFLSLKVIKLISEQLQIKSNGLYVILFIIISTPIILLEATTTQNDIVASFFFLSSLYFLLELKNKFNTSAIFLLIISLALGFLTKASILIFIFPFMCIYGIYIIKNFSFLFLKPIIAGIFLFLLIVSPYLIRNYNASNQLLGDNSIVVLMKNNEVSPTNTTLNFARNILMNVTLPNEKWNNLIDKIVQKTELTLQGSINNPINTYGPKFKASFSINEDLSGQSILFFIFFISCCVGIFKYKLFRFQSYLFLIGILFSFLLFSAIFKWQPWGVRFFIPLYMLMAIQIGLFSEPFLTNKRLQYSIVFFICCSLPFLFLNDNKPILRNFTKTISNKRYQNYFLFTSKINLYNEDDFTKVKNILREYKIKSIGIALENDTWEYPLWKSKPENSKMFYVRFPEVYTKLKIYDSKQTIEAIITDKRTQVISKKQNSIVNYTTKSYNIYILEKPIQITDCYTNSNTFDIKIN